VTAGAEVRFSTSPYPGLRPFQAYEADIFFGREEQTDEMLKKLRRARLLVVTGPSGCGKSSLVRAGMITALEAGFLTDAGGRWRIADMRPGEEPLQRLTRALLAPGLLAEEEPTPETAAFVRATLQRGPLGLTEVLRERPLPEGANLLLLVDQFEEIFRFRREGDEDEADAFVALLLASAAQRELPVYVVLTMRSDFLGETALFAGLPEAINDNQFLTPRLTRAQAEAAIAGPARVFGGEIDAVLVNRLLNDMGPEPDQLPVLQHLLMRMWVAAKARASRPDCPTVEVDDYAAVGTLANALSNHADEVYGSLDDRQKEIAEVMFRRLTDRGEDRRDTRRPTRLAEIAEVAGATPEEVAQVAEEFRKPERSFLMPPLEVPLDPETVLDIGHESLIRQWHRLSGWVAQEDRSVSFYRHLKQTARHWQQGEADLLGGVGLERTLAWRAERERSRGWATRYGSEEDFDLAMAFLAESERAKEVAMERERAERERRRWEEIDQRAEARAGARLRWRARALAVVAASALLVAGLAYDRQQAADRAKRRYEAQLRANETLLESLRVRNQQMRRASEELVSAALFRREVVAANSSLAALADAKVDSIEPKRVVPLVYIQFRGGLERSIMEELRAQLNREGFPAPGTEQMRYDFQTHVSFFYPQDRALARTVAEKTRVFFKARGCDFPVPLRHLPRGQSTAKPGQVEIWVHQNCPP
jgi:energy-coupling factor transporter ATP-binding protein EcfA2